MLKVMRRAADAPLDPPKHLGHGKCDTFNKSVQLGVATNNAERLGRETILMMKSLRIPPGELRGIGLQMGKLEKEVGNDGQKKLEFTKNIKTEGHQKPTDVPTEGSPAVMPESPAAITIMPQTPIKVTAPTQIDPDILANLPEDIRAQIVSRKPTKFESSQIDEEVFNELPPSIQLELRPQYTKPLAKITPKKKRPSPKKVKSLVGQSQLPLLSSVGEFDASVVAELPSPIRAEVLSNARREHALARSSKARHLAWAEEKAVRDRKVNRTVTIPDPPPKPTFQKVSELSDLRNLISMWFADFRDEGPADEDVELLGGYLRKVVLLEKDLRKAEAVVNWFIWCCRDTDRAAIDEWWDAGRRLGEHVNDACKERSVGKIRFVTQSL